MDTDERGNSAAPAARPVSARRRAMALVSLCSAVLLIIGFGWFLSGHARYVVIAIAGFAVTVAGGWWLITRRGARRVIGLLVLLTGLGFALAALVASVSQSDRLALELGVLVVLVGVTFGSARRALRRDVAEGEPLHTGGQEPPRHPVLICNPWSGGGKVEKFGLVALASELGIETVLLTQGSDLEQLARAAIARGADCLGMAGGDGSQALVASIAVEHDMPFVCVTAGTRNHFALDLGLDREDPRKSLSAFTDAIERRIDYATVNGRFFVNNVSLGIYATIVQQDQYREAKLETTTSLLPELLGRTEAPFDLEFTRPDGTDVKGAYLIQVSNNPYVMGTSLDVSQRRRLDSGRLGIVGVTGTNGGEAAAVVTLMALGQRNLSPNWHEFVAMSFEVRSQSGKAYAGVDGEALEMETPLHFAIHPGGLRLLVPRGNLVEADRRQARDVSLGSLVAVARGRNPGSSRQDAGPR